MSAEDKLKETIRKAQSHINNQQSPFIKKAVDIIEGNNQPPEPPPPPVPVKKADAPPPQPPPPPRLSSFDAIAVFFNAKIEKLRQWIETLLKKGHTSGVDADKVDGLHADEVAVKAAEIAEARGGSMFGITDHGQLQGLTDDDHAQYYDATRHTKILHTALGLFATDGSEAMTGNINFGGSYGVYDDAIKFALNRGVGAFEFRYINAVRVGLYREGTSSLFDLVVRSILPTDDYVCALEGRVRTGNAAAAAYYLTSYDTDFRNCAKLIGGYMDIMRGGDITLLVDKKVDCATNGGELHPARVSQSAQPTPTVNELQVWRDSDDGKTYLVYNDTTEGVRKVEMT